jgi:hypothetical protein
MNKKHSHPFIGIVILLAALLACNLPAFSQATPETIIVYITETSAPAATAVEAPPASTLPSINHVLYPANIQTAGTINYDVDSSGTSPEHRAPYGDIYRFNFFERPFTTEVMNYIPDLDIQTFRLQKDQDWFYIFIEVGGTNPESGTLSADYAVELDLDRDGHGDNLIWAKPPYTTAWTTDGVSVYEDTNNDSGGLSPTRTDAPFNGNGYDLKIFDSGTGSDADLAWVRIDPNSPTTIQFAFKKGLTGNAFMWGVWADLGVKDPAKFNYNDYFTEEQAGSPEKSEQEFYPIKSIHSVDNTCREAFGFDTTGYEPMLCPRIVPTPGPGGGPAPAQLVCTNPGQYYNQTTCEAADCRWVVYAGGGDIPYCTYP